MKLLTIAAALLAVNASPVPPGAAHQDGIHRVRCGRSSGTAFRISRDTLVTAQHVTANGPCSIGGVPGATAFESAGPD